MSNRVVILGIALMLASLTILLTGSISQTSDESRGFVPIGLPLAGFVGTSGLVLFVIGLILRIVDPIRIE